MALTVSDGFPYYIELTGKSEAKTLFTDRSFEVLLDSITEEKSKHRYADGKWSIKQIVGHIVDHERIMAYRTLRFSRKDKTPLPGYDQDLMVNNAYFDDFAFSQLVQDYKTVRASTVSFMNLLKPEQMKLTGMAWKFELTVDEMLRAIVGHEMHHIIILKDGICSFKGFPGTSKSCIRALSVHSFCTPCPLSPDAFPRVVFFTDREGSKNKSGHQSQGNSLHCCKTFWTKASFQDRRTSLTSLIFIQKLQTVLARYRSLQSGHERQSSHELATLH